MGVLCNLVFSAIECVDSDSFLEVVEEVMLGSRGSNSSRATIRRKEAILRFFGGGLGYDVAELRPALGGAVVRIVVVVVAMRVVVVGS